MVRLRNRNDRKLKATSERVTAILSDVNQIQTRMMKRSAAAMVGQRRLEDINSNLDEALKKQEQNLDKLNKLAHAR